MNKLSYLLFSPALHLLVCALSLSAEIECTCDQSPAQDVPETNDEAANKTRVLIAYKLTATCSILLASLLGISLPILGRKLPSLHPENHVFFLVKSFAAGVILSTGLVHILPDAFDSFASPSLLERSPWRNFPFAGFIAMLSAIATMMIDAFATAYFRRSHCSSSKALPVMVTVDEEERMPAGGDEHEGHVHVHTHATHGHAHGSALITQGQDLKNSDFIRHRVISQVLEIGVVVHSVIIGVSLGASHSPSTIKPLVAALTFHQLFEGIGLGGCISQAKFQWRAIATMMFFFCLTTPVGIAAGMGMSRMYKENGVKGLIVEGVLNSASAGILIYMALVDLIAADYMNPIMLSNLKLLVGASLSLLLGSASMSLLATWA